MLVLWSFGLVAIFVLFLHFRMRWKYRSLNKFGGPWNHVIIGAALEFGFNPVDQLKNLTRLHEAHGSVVIFQIGPTDMYLGMTDPDLVEFFISSPKFITKSDDYNMLRPWLGNGLLLSTGSLWKKRRRIITPTFHFKILDEFIPIFNSPLNILVERLTKYIDKEEFDIFPIITTMTLDIICETAMGTSVNAQSNSDHLYVRSIKNICNVFVERGFSPWKRFDCLFKLSPQYKQHLDDIKVVKDFADSIIKKKRLILLENKQRKLEKQNDFGIKQRVAFLDLLLEAEIDGKLLTDDEINEEVSTFMFEGHDTTASIICFILYELARNPECQTKAVKELEEIFGDDRDIQPIIQDLNNMKYLELVIKEALRLYPSVMFFSRKLEEDVMHENILYPKGLAIGFAPYLMHKRPDLFENPSIFNPERFLPENVTSKHPFSYIPFSAGPRNCIGQKFAMYEIKATISKLLRHFELLPVDAKFEPVISIAVVIKSENGIHIRLRKR